MRLSCLARGERGLLRHPRSRQRGIGPGAADEDVGIEVGDGFEISGAAAPRLGAARFSSNKSPERKRMERDFICPPARARAAGRVRWRPARCPELSRVEMHSVDGAGARRPGSTSQRARGGDRPRASPLSTRAIRPTSALGCCRRSPVSRRRAIEAALPRVFSSLADATASRRSPSTGVCVALPARRGR